MESLVRPRPPTEGATFGAYREIRQVWRKICPLTVIMFEPYTSSILVFLTLQPADVDHAGVVFVVWVGMRPFFLIDFVRQHDRC